MTPSEFTNELIEAYQRARKPTYPHEKLKRGISRSIPSEIEDLVAFYLVQNIPSIDQIFINQNIPISSGNKRKKTQPDLMIVSNDQVCALVDLKMDLGYQREGITNTFLIAEEDMEAIRGKKIAFRNGKQAANREECELSVSKDANYFFLVVSDQNIAKGRYVTVESEARKLSYVSLHTLIRGVHPNSYKHTEDDLKKLCLPLIEQSLANFQKAMLKLIS